MHPDLHLALHALRSSELERAHRHRHALRPRPPSPRPRARAAALLHRLADRLWSDPVPAARH